MISIFPLTSLEFGATFCICKIFVYIRDLKKCVYMSMCACVFACVGMGMYIGVCTYVHVKDRKLMFDVFFYCSPPSLLRQGLSLNQSAAF